MLAAVRSTVSQVVNAAPLSRRHCPQWQLIVRCGKACIATATLPQ